MPNERLSQMQSWAAVALVLGGLGCGEVRAPAPQGEFLGEAPPSANPVLFASGFVSTDLCERDFTLSAAGDEAYFTIQGGRSFRDWFSAIATTRRGADGWSPPALAPFSGRYSDLEPSLSPDGQRLYFVSNRPRDGDGEAREDFDVWFVDRVGDGWGEPHNVGAPINTDKDEFYPSVTRDGVLYVTASYEGPENIWRAEPAEGGGFGEPENLGEAVNAGRGAYNAFIAPDESYLIYGRGRGLHVSFRDADGQWSEAASLGDAFNWGGLDYCPFVSADGRYLFFTSTRPPAEDYPRRFPPGFDALLAQVASETDRAKLRTRMFPYADLYWASTAVIDSLRNAVGVSE